MGHRAACLGPAPERSRQRRAVSGGRLSIRGLATGGCILLSSGPALMTAPAAQLQTTPDGDEVVAAASDPTPSGLAPLLVLEPVLEFMDARGLGSGPLSWARIGDG